MESLEPLPIHPDAHHIVPDFQDAVGWGRVLRSPDSLRPERKPQTVGIGHPNRQSTADSRPKVSAIHLTSATTMKPVTPQRPQLERRPSHPQRRLSIALGGGGARGLAHLGALCAIADAGAKVDHIAGVSIGALAGALSAFGKDPTRVQEEVLDFVDSPRFRRKRRQLFSAGGHRPNARSQGWVNRLGKLLSATRVLSRVAILSSSVLEEIVNRLLPDAQIEDAAIPLSVIAVDLRSGRRVVLEQGPLRRAVAASASIPGVFPPVPWGDMLLSDIGAYDNVPVAVAKRHSADLTLAVDVSAQLQRIEHLTNVVDVFSRVQQLAEHEIRHRTLREADLVVTPDLGPRAWFDFDVPEELVCAGYVACEQQLVSLGASASTPLTAKNRIH